MLNPSDVVALETGEGLEELDPNMVAEFENGKGDDEDESDGK